MSLNAGLNQAQNKP